LDNLETFDHTFATFRQSLVQNNEQIKNSICTASKVDLQYAISEQKEITSLNYFQDLSIFRNGRVPSKLLFGLKDFCKDCILPLSVAHLMDVGIVKYGPGTKKSTYLAIIVNLELYKYNTYPSMLLLRFINAGRTVKSTLGNNKHIRLDLPNDIWVDSKNNISYTGEGCASGMLSDQSLFCDSLVAVTGCVSDLIKYHKSDSCNYVVDYLDYPCSTDHYDSVGLLCKGPKVSAGVSQTYNDRSQDYHFNLTTNCSLVDFSKSTTSFSCDGKSIYTQNSLTTYFQIQDFNVKDISKLNINLTDFSKMSFKSLKDDFKSSFDNLSYKNMLTIYVLVGTALVLTISLVIWMVKFKKCCKRKIQSRRVNFLSSNSFFVNASLPNKSGCKKSLKNLKASFEKHLTNVTNIETTEFRATKIYNINNLNKIIKNIQDALELISLRSRFSSSVNLKIEFNNFIKELTSFDLYLNALDLEKTRMTNNLPAMDSTIIAEYRTLL
jgi:hypothetical protein